MAFFRRVKKRLQGDDPQQLKRELQWLQTQVGRYKGKILAVGLLSLTGTIMGLISSVASKYLIDAVTGYGADMLWRAVAIMAVMLLGSLVLQGVSSRVGASGNRYPTAAVASDAHSPRVRTPWMEDVRDLLAQEFSPRCARALLLDNPRKILKDEPITLAEPEWFR